MDERVYKIDIETANKHDPAAMMSQEFVNSLSDDKDDKEGRMKTGNTIHKFNYTFDIHKARNNDQLYIYGVASTQDKDRDGETVVMKSLNKAFQKFMRRNPILMYQHNGRNDAVGKVIPEFTGKDGTVYKSQIINNELYIVGQISRAASAADVRTQIEEGILKSFSIGGRARKVQKASQTCVMVSDLQEISIVTIPANDSAMFNVIKSACVGDNCPIQKTESNITEDKSMDKEEIVEIVVKTLTEMKAADDYETLQKKYDALVVDTNTTVVPEVEVEKSLAEQVTELKAEIESMKTTPMSKGIQDGEEKVEKAATDITSIIMTRHYGGN